MSRVLLVQRKIWTTEELRDDIAKSIEEFQKERLLEPLEAYLGQFDEVQDAIENLLEGTVDLSRLEEMAVDLLKDQRMLEAIRYLAGPPISVDDLKTLADSNSLAPGTLERDSEIVKRVIQTIRSTLDRRRFPWVSDNREPTNEERHAAIIASAALIAAQRTATVRRNEGKTAQEDAVKAALIEAKFVRISVPGNVISTLAGGPKPGEFTGEVQLAGRRADVTAGLWDTRILPIECKVSNSSTNSIKRLNNDAAVKAEVWLKDLGRTNVVPTAVLSGVYKVRNVLDAQDKGLQIFWAHRLSDLIKWIESTRK